MPPSQWLRLGALHPKAALPTPASRGSCKPRKLVASAAGDKRKSFIRQSCRLSDGEFRVMAKRLRRALTFLVLAASHLFYLFGF